MNGDNKELVEYLDKKFVKIDDKFVKIDERFDKIDEKLVKVDKRIESLQDIFVTKDEFNSAIENLATKEDLNNLMTAVDTYAKKADTFF